MTKQPRANFSIRMQSKTIVNPEIRVIPVENKLRANCTDSCASQLRTARVIFVPEIYHFLFVIFSELKKLSEESLTRQPEEVFDIICKLGEG